jgi:anthranilate phosphoribosyltransferase
MNENSAQFDANQRMKSYLGKIATGPRMSKDLTRAEAEDALSLILNGEVSRERSAVFLIAARMKLETVEENTGYWQALDKTTVKQEVKLDKLVQVAEAFDGFERTPVFTFYTIPLLAEMGLPAYGHSALPLPPKFGITFEDLLVNHYGVSANQTFEQRKTLIEQFGFGYLGIEQTHPKLDALKSLRVEIVKRPMLATMEKMLMPLEAKSNYLATNYFHPGYEEAMLAVAGLGGWEIAVVGNGMEGSILYGVHKTAKLYIHLKKVGVQEKKLDCSRELDASTAQQVQAAFAALKKVPASLNTIAELGEQALQGKGGPAGPLIAWQAATLGYLFGRFPDVPTGFEAATQALKSSACYQKLMEYLEECKRKE